VSSENSSGKEVAESSQATRETTNLTPGQISVAFEKLFGGGRGVSKFARSGLRYVKLGKDAMLIEQNPAKKSEWARLAKEGRHIAWLMREGEYLARVVDGEVTMLEGNDE
jgi:hypothetical protein